MLLAIVLHLSIAAGAGLAQDVVGVQLQLREGHFAAFGAIGPIGLDSLFSEFDDHSAAFGVRWYKGDGDGLFVSAQWFFWKSETCTGSCSDREFPPTWELDQAATLVAGLRYRWTHLFIDAGAGGGLFFAPGARPHVIPDATLAIGWEF